MPHHPTGWDRRRWARRTPPADVPRSIGSPGTALISWVRAAVVPAEQRERDHRGESRGDEVVTEQQHHEYARQRHCAYGRPDRVRRHLENLIQLRVLDGRSGGAVAEREDTFSTLEALVVELAVLRVPHRVRAGDRGDHRVVVRGRRRARRPLQRVALEGVVAGG